jgi:hypothetical protein
MSFAILEHFVAFERFFYKHKGIIARLRPQDPLVVMGIAIHISFLFSQDQYR